MGRLVEALNACWLPHATARAGTGSTTVESVTLAGFKRAIRERDVWCSSCMIAFEGALPIGVLIGAKRATGTLIDRIAVRPDRLRRGHGRHMLDSLGAKLAILGPPRMVAELPDDDPVAATFFAACGFVREDDLTDWVLDPRGAPARPLPAAGHASGGVPGAPPGAGGEAFPVPVTVADLVANRLLSDPPGVAWNRAAASLQARAEAIQGIGLATVDQIEAYVLYRPSPGGAAGATIDALASVHEIPAGSPAAPAEALRRLVTMVLERTGPPILFPRLSGREIPTAWMQSWGFRPAADWHRWAAMARSG